VVDKDRSSALLAHALDAEAMICLTAVEAVMLDFDTPRERPIATATVEEMRQWLAEGQFPEGSMGPKVRSAIQFLEDGGKEVLITSPEELPRAIRGETGTRILAV
jgi:carbamate kinase